MDTIISFLQIIFKSVEVISLVVLIIASVLAIKNIFEEEEINFKDSIKEIVYSLLAFFIFLLLSGDNIPIIQGFTAFLLGLSLGFITSYTIRIYEKKPLWYTKGTMIFLIIWAINLLISEVSEQFFSETVWWWLFIAIFSFAMMVGEIININLRKKVTSGE